MLEALGLLGILILYALWEILRTLQRIEAFQRHVEDKREQRRDRREELRADAEDTVLKLSRALRGRAPGGEEPQPPLRADGGCPHGASLKIVQPLTF